MRPSRRSGAKTRELTAVRAWLEANHGRPPAARLQVAGRRFRLTGKQVRFAFDTATTAKRAYYTGHTNPAVDVPLCCPCGR
jgi:hypothetical protein